MLSHYTKTLFAATFFLLGTILQAQPVCDFQNGNSSSTLSWYGYDNVNNTGGTLINNWNAAPGVFNYNIEYSTIGTPSPTPYILHLDAEPIASGGSSPQWITSQPMTSFNFDYNKLQWSFWIGRRGVSSAPSSSRISTVWLYIDNPANINNTALLTGYRLTWYHTTSGIFGVDRMQLVEVQGGTETIIGDFYLRLNTGIFQDTEFGTTVLITREPMGSPNGTDAKWELKTSAAAVLNPTSVPANTPPTSASTNTRISVIDYNTFVPPSSTGYMAVWSAFDDVARVAAEYGQLCFLDIGPTPVELTSFTAEYRNEAVNLNWHTATETNNYGFEVLRSIEHNGDWETIGFVDGNGTSSKPNDYSFTDVPNADGASVVAYRLKQIDRDGSFEYSNTILVSIAPKSTDVLYNFPNPFNPATNITFTLLQNDIVTLNVYNTAGEKVAELLDTEPMSAGYHTASFDGTELPSGRYFYRLTTSAGTKTNSMVLSK